MLSWYSIVQTHQWSILFLFIHTRGMIYDWHSGGFTTFDRNCAGQICVGHPQNRAFLTWDTFVWDTIELSWSGRRSFIKSKYASNSTIQTRLKSYENLCQSLNNESGQMYIEKLNLKIKHLHWDFAAHFQQNTTDLEINFHDTHTHIYIYIYIQTLQLNHNWISKV